jgi:putative acetyltransferase
LIRPAQESDAGAVLEVQAEAFGGDHGARVAELVTAVVSAPLKVISLVAEEDEQVVGHVLMSAARIDAASRLVDLYYLSPLGVLPARQRRGLDSEPHW